MPPPIKRRTSLSYARDIESLVRLRSAVLMDFTLDGEERGAVIEEIDKLADKLGTVIRRLRERESGAA